MKILVVLVRHRSIKKPNNQIATENFFYVL